MGQDTGGFSYPAMIDSAERQGCYRWAEQLRENWQSEQTWDGTDTQADA